MKYLVILLLLISRISYGQLMQANNTPGGYKWKAGKIDSLLIMPIGLDTPAMGSTKYGEPTKGAFFYKTTDSSFWIRSDYRWNRIGGSGIGSNIITGTIESPGGTITLPPGYYYQDIIFFGTGIVSTSFIGYGEKERMDNDNIYNPRGTGYAHNLDVRPQTPFNVYVDTEFDIIYEIIRFQ